MTLNLSPSVNIVRDAERPSNYIPTANSRHIYTQIASQFKSGVRSFSIVGSYGTGKSAFLLALINHFNGNNTNTFGSINGEFNGLKKFEFISIVGENRSLLEVFAEKFNTEPNQKDIFKALKKKRDELKQQNLCCIILADEFGKFLEFATNNDPSVQLYFLQQLAEFINDPDKNFLFLTTLHQNFDAYSIGAADDLLQRKEWEKVKGRFKELTFNEPVEQLLQLAGDFMSSQKWNTKKTVNTDLLNVVTSSGVFRLLTDISEDFVEKLYPFDLASAMCLTVALQKYGQNERSLFSFLTTDEYLGLNHFRDNQGRNPYFNLACVYDYLVYNYYSVLTSKSNPDFFKWVVVRNTLERVYLHCTERVDELEKIVKAIGLLDILGSDAAKIDVEFLEIYAHNCLGINNVLPLIETLETKKIIHFQAFKKRFKLFEGTDENIELLLQRMRLDVQISSDLIPELTDYIEDKYIVAKAVSYKQGTPRIFEYKISKSPILKFNEKNHEIDAYVNLIFSNTFIDMSQIGINEPILYGIYRNADVLRKSIIEIEAISKAIGEVAAKKDSVAQDELQQLKDFHLKELNNHINHQLFDKDSPIDWYFEGNKITILSKKAFNQTLSTVCEKVYYAVPEYRNELINRVSFSNNIPTARRFFIEALCENATKPDFGFDSKDFPPQKTIYYSLCKATNILRTEGGQMICSPPTGNPSFDKLWEVSTEFLNSTQSGKRPLSELIEKLYDKPFRLKDGFVDFWVLVFLIGHQEEYALFKNGAYIPRVNKDVAELFFKEAKNYEIKKFSVQGVKLDLFNKYRELTKQSFQDEITNSSFQETAKPFLIFYKKLSNYSKQTKSVSSESIAFRKILATAKDLEKLFFEELPACFGTTLEKLNNSENDLNDFVARMNQCISELRLADDGLTKHVEDIFYSAFAIENKDFDALKDKIKERYKSIKDELLYPHQKTLVNRLKAELDKNAWLNSVVQAVLKKQLPDFTDEDERLLNTRLNTSFKELDDLLEWSKMTFDTEKEQALTIEIRGTDELKLKSNLILTKKQTKEVSEVEQEIKKILKNHKQSIKQAVLINLLKRNLGNDKD